MTYPGWAIGICNHYWHLRYCRGFHAARIRKEYRRIEAEKKRLQSEGVDAELLRLLCRHMVNPRSQVAEQRFWKRLEETAQKCFEF